jgi:ribose transport system ATP-binding protein
MITKRYPGVLALDEVSMAVRVGEVHGLVGENGAGKSTLIKVLAGAHAPDGGEIFFDEKTFSALKPHQAMDLGIACIYQELNQVPYMTVAENIFLGRELKRKYSLLDRKAQLEQASSCLRTSSWTSIQTPLSGIWESDAGRWWKSAKRCTPMRN